MTGKITSEPATAQDIQEYFGQNVPHTIRAWVLKHEGEVVALGGYHVSGARALVFSEIRDGVSLPKMTIYRSAKKLMGLIKLPATCRSDNEKLMRSLGWRHVIEDTWEWQHSQP